jgi:hypothetical protein
MDVDETQGQLGRDDLDQKRADSQGDPGCCSEILGTGLFRCCSPNITELVLSRGPEFERLRFCRDKLIELEGELR